MSFAQKRDQFLFQVEKYLENFCLMCMQLKVILASSTVLIQHLIASSLKLNIAQEVVWVEENVSRRNVSVMMAILDLIVASE